MAISTGGYFESPVLSPGATSEPTWLTPASAIKLLDVLHRLLGKGDKSRLVHGGELIGKRATFQSH
jgi:hypothetical protein